MAASIARTLTAIVAVVALVFSPGAAAGASNDVLDADSVAAAMVAPTFSLDDLGLRSGREDGADGALVDVAVESSAVPSMPAGPSHPAPSTGGGAAGDHTAGRVDAARAPPTV